MEKGVWRSWQLILGTVLTIACLSCQPRMASMPRQAPPPPPVAAPQPPPQHETFYVKVARLNLRAGPGMDFPKLGLLERNEEVEKLGEAENWYQVRVKRDGTLGWVSSEYLSSTPVTSPIVSPVPETPPAPAAKEKPPAETKPEKPGKETVVPRAPKPAEAAEEPAPKAKQAEEAAPAPKAVKEKPEPKQVEPPPPPAPQPPPPPPQPEEQQGGGIRIM